MSLLFETIKLNSGVFYNLEYHEKRMVNSIYNLYGIHVNFFLKEHLNDLKIPKYGLHKVKVIYDKYITGVEVTEYKKRKIDKIYTIHDENIDYQFKYLNRSCFESYRTVPSSEFLFIKNGKVTDTTFSNVAFFDGKIWVTPSTFLLNGTKRQYYIDKNVLKVADVRLTDIAKYKNISLINAMLDLEDIVIDIKNIHF